MKVAHGLSGAKYSFIAFTVIGFIVNLLRSGLFALKTKMKVTIITNVSQNTENKNRNSLLSMSSVFNYFCFFIIL